MTEIEKALRYFTIAGPESEEQSKAYFQARKALLAQQEADKNEPLTPDELKSMVGEPVWTVGVCCATDMWDIIENVDDEGIYFGYSTESPEWWSYNLRNFDGKLCGCAWVAYRHKPKEG